MYVGVPGLYETFFGNVAETAAKTTFKKWRESDNPLYYEEGGWDRWPQDTTHEDNLSWINIIRLLPTLY